MKKINFEVGTQISPAKVTIDNVDHKVTPAVWEGNTPLSPFVLNTLQDNIEKEFQVDKTIISGKTSQEGTPSPDNIVPIKNANVYGMNELKIPDYTFTSLGVTTTVSNERITTKGKTEASYFYLSDFMDCNIPAGNYIFSLDKTFNFQIEVGIKYSDDTRGDFTIVNARIKNVTFAKRVKAFRLAISWLSAGTNVNYNFVAKIEKDRGVAATPYTPYNYGLLDLNLQKDADTKTVKLISKRLHEGDSVEESGLHYNRKTLVLNGTEDLELWGNGTSSSYRLIYKEATNIIKKDGVILSNYYTMKTANELYEGIAGITIDTSGNIIIHDSRFTTLEAWKTHLANQYANGTPVTIEYELAEQENEQFNEENQTAWNTLENLLLQGYTFINSSSDELQPMVTLTEYTANEIHRENVEKFKKLEEINNYSTEETVIGKWINRKPLYRKVYEVSTPSALTFTKVITLDSIIKVTKCDIKVDATNGASFIVPYYSASDDFISSYIYDGVYLKVSKSNYQSLPCYITLEYTKTTD